ncbi:lytic transglycosylase domain-containing protein [Thalassococcus sp. CAU 1522]|uniref:Lytic transglycosylase domain-containing protein n=1 Tax=Thalassococcus arenae TaxID=2851652 RepID=A0ABS6N2Q7_9RHOB|nr:lytic transglycosylase domain-containing protein [Thalassococcus arenae]MBV2358293.1 lytic transglycosylase domain-containing protein [Thalassococcus arenae]
MLRLLAIALVLLPAPALQAEPGTMCSRGVFAPVECIRPSHFVHDTCQAIANFAKAHLLDAGFFARLIWQESRFDPNARSPANAQGIAQFIPSTAALRGLRDPYNPAEALEFSAEYLGELARRYGNAGLAAVAYNGGEARADGLVGETGGLARETVDYVQIITGLTAETWRDEPPENHDFRLQKAKAFLPACHDLARKRRLTAFPRPEPAVRPWGVQVAFGTTKGRASDQFKARTRSCAALVEGEKPDLIWQKSRASPRGGYFMVRIGRDDRDEAWRYCARLKAQGCLCAVYRNR